MQKITPFLWFDNQAEQAVEFYLSVFKNAKRGEVVRTATGVMTVSFELEGLKIVALNGGPVYKLNESFSLYVPCETQTEIDYYWDKLTADGGEPGMCGWLKDKFGLSWQIVPPVLPRMLADSDPARAKRVMAEMMTMHKLDITRLQRAYDG